MYHSKRKKRKEEEEEASSDERYHHGRNQQKTENTVLLTIHEMQKQQAEKEKGITRYPIFHHQTPPLHACRYSSR